MKFKSKYLSEFQVKFEMASGYETQAQMGTSDEKKTTSQKSVEKVPFK
jgi:hypothetical protein